VFIDACYRLLRSPDRKLRLGAFLQPVQLWNRLSAIKQNYPETWKWVLQSRQIQGWLTDGEADQLFKLARDFTPHSHPVVVELGSWKGKSAVMLAAGLIEKENPELFCVDPFGCDENVEYQQKYYAALLEHDSHSTGETFRNNMRTCGVDSIARQVKGYSFDIVRTWTRPIDVLFIDASHEYPAVLRDFETWVEFLKQGGVIAFHDANGKWPGPTRVVQEKLQPPKFGPVNAVDTLAWAVIASTTELYKESEEVGA
jgi:MMP 1-O-methyltransferase